MRTRVLTVAMMVAWGRPALRAQTLAFADWPLVAKLGDSIRIRFMNEGMMIHPMHLHGMHMTVIDKDGWQQPAPWKCDTLDIAPGERWDVIVKCHNPGTWAFHCHILPHAESDHGMFGMVPALVVQT